MPCQWVRRRPVAFEEKITQRFGNPPGGVFSKWGNILGVNVISATNVLFCSLKLSRNLFFKYVFIIYEKNNTTFHLIYFLLTVITATQNQTTIVYCSFKLKNLGSSKLSACCLKCRLDISSLQMVCFTHSMWINSINSCALFSFPVRRGPSMWVRFLFIFQKNVFKNINKERYAISLFMLGSVGRLDIIAF